MSLRSLYHSLIVSSFLVLQLAVASELSELRNTQYLGLNTILLESEQSQVALKKRYFAELLKVRQQSTRLGSLERLEALDAEIHSFAFTQCVCELPAEDGELARLRDVYREQCEHIQLQEAQKISQWHSDYTASLAAIKRAAIKAGDVAQAKEVRAEVEKISAEERVSAAAALVAEAAKTPAKSETPASFDSEWISLSGLDCEAEGGHYFNHAIKNESDWVRHYRGKGYARSEILYSHSPGKYTFHFAEPIQGFQAIACIENRSKKGNVVFTIETDTEGEVHRTEAIHGSRRGEDIEIAFQPANTLILSVLSNGGGAEDWAFWLKPAISFTYTAPEPTEEAEAAEPTE